MTSIKLNNELFNSRIQKLIKIWTDDSTEVLRNCSSIVFSLGKPSQATVYQKSTAFFNWLLGFEFSDTVIILRKASIVFLTSESKKNILSSLRSSHIDIQIIIKPQPEEYDNFFKQNSIFPETSTNIGHLPKDKVEGKFITFWKHWYCKTFENTCFDISVDISTLLAVKDNLEQSYIANASKLSSFFFENVLIKTILEIVDTRKKKSHSSISADLEDIFEDSIKIKSTFRNFDLDVDLSSIDLCYPPIIQSGRDFSLKPSTLSSDKKIDESGVFICSFGLRYNSYCSNMTRTLLINCPQNYLNNFSFLQEMYNYVLSLFVPNQRISSIYEKGLEYVNCSKFSHLESNICKNYGFGIGIEFRQSEYLINSKNHKLIKEGMTFNFMLGFENIEGDYTLAISNTILVAKDSIKILTNSLSELKDISFSISKPVQSLNTVGIKTRNQKADSSRSKKANDEMRRIHQKKIAEDSRKEAIKRIDNTPKQFKDVVKSQHGTTKSCYKSEKFMKNSLASEKQIIIDAKKEAVLFPIQNVPVAFHISSIKSISKIDDGDFSLFKVFFQFPTTAFNDVNLKKFHFLKGLDIKIVGDKQRSDLIYQKINELKKSFSEKESIKKERVDVVAQNDLIEAQSFGKMAPRLIDIYMRPSFDGKRSPGNLEIHQNGIRYRSQLRSDHFDILFSNIKHLIFQSCEKEMYVIIHINLHTPLLIAKKKTYDVQFYREALESMIDETVGGKRTKLRFGDDDEIAQEIEEKKRRDQADAEFKSFAQRIASSTTESIEVDIPFRELGFYGVPSRQNVLLQPTTDCLVQLNEYPFTVITISEVEVIFLERLVFGLKNFDMVFVFKDHDRSPYSINSIPIEYLEGVKDWIDSVDIFFIESKVNFNWNNLMKTIFNDPKEFYELGGWKSLEADTEDINQSDEEQSSEYEMESSEENFESESMTDSSEGDDDITSESVSDQEFSSSEESDATSSPKKRRI